MYDPGLMDLVRAMGELKQIVSEDRRWQGST